MARDLIGMARRALKKPPRIIIKRLAQEGYAVWQRLGAPWQASALGERTLAAKFGERDLEALWQRLAARPYPAQVRPVARERYERVCPGDAARIEAAAGRALAHEIDLLGSGPLALGEAIDWSRDYKTGFDWPQAYCRAIDYNNPERPSDVKMAWELSRMQWAIPLGQAYLLTGDERYAEGARRIIESWIAANPYAYSVNWACTMEVALRVLTWTWFFHVFHAAESWRAPAFRAAFLRSLWLHCAFTERNLEESDVNGNHFTADAAGLVVGGHFFRDSAEGRRWAERGWTILVEELPRQVFPDGVDFEASVPYHRLVLELFWLPAAFRRLDGEPIEPAYQARLSAMFDFVAAYVRPDGSTPLLGDADDARALPFGPQPIGDHRYLLGLGGVWLGREELRRAFGGSRAEVFWLLGEEAALALPDSPQPEARSVAFPHAGVYVLRDERTHVFVDCAPIGMAGRGGHGHNDCLSFEAHLDGVPVVSDCGAYLYTASYEERNRFRSTAYHNTPRVDGEELNRFIRPDYLWNMHDDARPHVARWQPAAEATVLEAGHSGYERLALPVRPVRTFVLDHGTGALLVADRLDGEGEHQLEVPLHLAPGVTVAAADGDRLELASAGRSIVLVWRGSPDWRLAVEDARVSPSYGVVVPSRRLVWRREGKLPAELAVLLAPADAPLEALWARTHAHLAR